MDEYLSSEVAWKMIRERNNEIESLRQQLDEEINRRYEGNRISSKELAAYQKQNAALKEALIGWRQRAWPGTDQRAVVERDYPEIGDDK